MEKSNFSEKYFSPLTLAHKFSLSRYLLEFNFSFFLVDCCWIFRVCGLRCESQNKNFCVRKNFPRLLGDFYDVRH